MAGPYDNLWGGSRSGIRQSRPPEHERVLDRSRVVRPADAGDSKAEALVEIAGRVVRSPHLERRPLGPEPDAFRQDEGQEGRCHPRPAELGRHGEIVDVQFVEHAPERTETGRAPGRIARDET